MSLISLFKRSSEAFISISSLVYRMPIDKKFYYSKENLIIDRYNLDTYKDDFVNKLKKKGNFPCKKFNNIYKKIKKDPYLDEKKINNMIEKIF